MSQSQTVTTAEIEALPQMLRTEFPDVWEAYPTFQSAVPVLQREIAKLHEDGLDVSGLVRAVIQLGESEQHNAAKHTAKGKQS
jgi:hypothetical protein